MSGETASHPALSQPLPEKDWKCPLTFCTKTKRSTVALSCPVHKIRMVEAR